MRLIKYFSIGVFSIAFMLALVAAYFIVPVWSKLPSAAEIRRISEEVETPLDTLPNHVYLATLAAEGPTYLTSNLGTFQSTIRCLPVSYHPTDCNWNIPRAAFHDYIYTRSASRPTLDWRLFELLLLIKTDYILTRKQILELAINNAYFGHNSVGISQAAQKYYSKTASDLTLAQSALLAGLLKAPTRYNPITSPERAMNRRNRVLELMVFYEFISNEQSTIAMTDALLPN